MSSIFQTSRTEKVFIVGAAVFVWAAGLLCLTLASFVIFNWERVRLLLQEEARWCIVDRGTRTWQPSAYDTEIKTRPSTDKPAQLPGKMQKKRQIEDEPDLYDYLCKHGLPVTASEREAITLNFPNATPGEIEANIRDYLNLHEHMPNPLANDVAHNIACSLVQDTSEPVEHCSLKPEP